MVAHGAFLIAHGPKSIGYEFGGGLAQLDYSMTRMGSFFTDGGIWYPDCARAVNWCCKWAGWKGIGPYGFEADSQEMWEELPHFTDIRDCHAGTIIVWGTVGQVHATQVMHPDGDDPWLMSHGFAFSGNYERYSAEYAYHVPRGAPPTLLSVRGLG
jgi:hypothetical protein